MNTGTLMPYDIIAPIANASIGRAAEISETERKTGQSFLVWGEHMSVLPG